MDWLIKLWTGVLSLRVLGSLLQFLAKGIGPIAIIWILGSIILFFLSKPIFFGYLLIFIGYLYRSDQRQLEFPSAHN